MGIIAPDSNQNSQRKNKIAPEKSSSKTRSSSKSSLPGLLVFIGFIVVFFFIFINTVIPGNSASKKSDRSKTQNQQTSVQSKVQELGGVKNEAELKEILNEIGTSSSEQKNLLPYEKLSYTHSYSKDSDGLYDFTNCVIDDAQLLSESEYVELSSYLANLNKSKGVQIAVLTVKSLNGEDIESFSLCHAEKWNLGQKNVDNGALLTVAFEEKAIRIETGYGTEGVLTDAKCARIIRNVIAPSFQSGKYGEGIIEGVKNMAGIITQDESLISESVENENAKTSVSSIPIIIILVIFFFFYFRAIIYGITHRGRSRSSRGIHRTINNFYSSSNSHHTSGNFSSGGTSFHGGGGHFGGGGASGHW